MAWYNPLTYGMDDRPDIYSPDKKSYDMKLGAPAWAQKQAEKTASLTPGADLRKRQTGALDLMTPFATGDTSAAKRAADYSFGKAKDAITSQTAGAMRGGYSPALARAAQFATAKAARDTAAVAAPAAAREQLGAQQALLSAIQGGRGQDIQSTLGLERLAQGYRQQGLSDKAARQQALMQYEKAMLARSQMEQAAYQSELDTANKLWGGMLETGGALAGKLLG